MEIAVIGVGEVGRCFASALHRVGAQLQVCDAHATAAARDLAGSLGLRLHDAPGAWLADTDWVISCVTGSNALAVAQQALPHMRDGAGYADMTTASRGVKQAAERVGVARAVRYVDVAIMGAITLHWERTPLLAAGSGAAEFRDLAGRFGGRVKVIEGGSAGDAITLKILRSVFTKGMEALSVELLTSAERLGVRERLFEQLSDIDESPLRDFVEMLVRTHIVHAGRRAHEVHEAQAELAAQGAPSLVLPGVEQRFLDTAARLQQRPVANPQPTIEEALQWLLDSSPA